MIKSNSAMFKLISKKEAEDLLLYDAGPNATDNYWDVSLSQYPNCYRIHQAYQFAFDKDDPDLMKQLEGSSLPEVPDGSKVTVVLEMTTLSPMSQLVDIHKWATGIFDSSKLERFDPVFLYEGAFESRITVIYHDAKQRRSFCSRINSQARRLRDMDLRLARKLDEELSRNDEVETVVEIDVDQAHQMIRENHLLWTDVASSNRSISDIVRHFRREGLDRTVDEFEIRGLFLFFEVDRDYTTMGEVNNLKSRLKEMVGDVDVLFNVRIRDSFIKVMTCRGVLVGGPKYVKGEVLEDFGQFGILLYESEDRDRGHEIIASLAQGEFTLSRYDWGDFERNRRGETDEHHYFDEENTEKLFGALKVKKPEALLRTIRRRFASRRASCADLDFLAFCRKEGIEYKSDYYY